MAKVGFWLRSAKGKLAGATLYQQNGETVMREVNTSPSNPKTTKQLIQRIIMHTAMGSYSAMKEIVDHSFEGIKAGQETMSYYMKQNIQFAREKIAQQEAAGVYPEEMFNYAPLGKRGFTPNQYQVAMGSLPQVKVTLLDPKYTPIMSGFSANTYEDVINTLGLQRGDQLTFLCIGTANSTAPTYGMYEFKFARVILDPTNADGTSAPLTEKFVNEDGTINKPSPRNEGSFTFKFNTNKQIEFYFSKWTYQNSVAAAVIVSRESSNGTWLRSTSYLTYAPAEGEVYSLQDCIDLAQQGTATPIYTANSRYLNNAGTGSTSTIGGNTDTGDLPAVSGVVVNGVSLIQGTKRTVTLANGTTLPTNLTVTVTASNANGLKARIMNGTTVVSSGAISNGSCSLQPSCNSGITYKVDVYDEVGETDYESAFSFDLVVNSSTDGGGDDDGTEE